jgi:hypothetical protein
MNQTMSQDKPPFLRSVTNYVTPCTGSNSFQELNKEKTESIKEKESTIKTREECIEAKRKSAKTIQILSTAKEKISNQMREIDRLSTESKSFAEKLKSAEQRNCKF